jgi:major vault protein
MADENRNDLVLNPNEYAYVLDMTKGQVSVYVGPNKTSLSNSDRLVQYNSTSKRFEPCDYKNAIKLFCTAPEGWYILLKNPEESGKHPTTGSVSNSPSTIQIGQKVNIKGPCSFALYPGQMARTIQGHTLHSNQYLLVRVYDADAANKTLPVGAETKYVTGNLIIIKGTDRSFYIPETGFEVIPVNNDPKSGYVRNAVTLERLEYCILKDEDGNKRYMHGPAVVFPEPTETFVEQNGSIKYKAIELSEISGVYVKVIADYTDSITKQKYKTGEELFITGKDQMIYYPRPEHALISYDGNSVYHAIAIPKGEGRYVMNRMTGDIKTVKGPAMFLPDPRNEVIVNRRLSKSECELWYPGNQEVLAHNLGSNNNVSMDSLMTTVDCSYLSTSAANAVSKALRNVVFEDSTFDRKSGFTKPRSITFDNKYDGVVSLNVWTGYAVDVVSKDGTRKVIRGPQTILLDYDQTLEALSFSTGKPKTTDKMISTVYLRYKNNKISDIINVETNDFVTVEIKVSYNVDFDETHIDKWFSVDNYVKLLCDKMRSDVKRGVKQYDIQEFYHNYSEIVRELIFNGNDRRTFDDNGMVLKDVDVLSIHVDSEIKTMLEKNQRQMIANMLSVQMAEANFNRNKKEVEMQMQIESLKHSLALSTINAQKEEEDKNRELIAAKSRFDESEAKAHLEAERERDNIKSEIEAQQFERNKIKENHRLEIRNREIEQTAKEKQVYADTVAKIMESVSPDLIAAMQHSSNAETLRSVSEAMAPLAIARGESVADTVNTLMRGTSLENMFGKIAQHSEK